MKSSTFHRVSIRGKARFWKACRTVALATAIVGIGAPATFADDAGLIANACTSCHGVDGRSQSAIPSIAGVDPVIFAQIMRSFASDSLVVTIMNRIAKAYSDEQILLLANYFSAR